MINQHVHNPTVVQTSYIVTKPEQVVKLRKIWTFFVFFCMAFFLSQGNGLPTLSHVMAELIVISTQVMMFLTFLLFGRTFFVALFTCNAHVTTYVKDVTLQKDHGLKAYDKTIQRNSRLIVFFLILESLFLYLVLVVPIDLYETPHYAIAGCAFWFALMTETILARQRYIIHYLYDIVFRVHVVCNLNPHCDLANAVLSQEQNMKVKKLRMDVFQYEHWFWYWLLNCFFVLIGWGLLLGFGISVFFATELAPTFFAPVAIIEYYLIGNLVFLSIFHMMEIFQVVGEGTLHIQDTKKH